MASTYSSDLKLELMATGENAGTWGDKTNTNLNVIQQAIAGFEQVTLSSGGTLALVMSDGALSNARNMVIKFATATIAASTVCTIPDSIEKFYIFDATGLTNPTNLTIKTASGSGFTLPNSMATSLGGSTAGEYVIYGDQTGTGIQDGVKTAFVRYFDMSGSLTYPNSSDTRFGAIFTQNSGTTAQVTYLFASSGSAPSSGI